MPVVFLRIDDRYIHGQVTSMWMQTVNGQAIWIASDALAKNPFLKSLQESLAPPGTKVEISSMGEAKNHIKTMANRSDRIVLLVANPTDALELIKSGLKIDCINVGQIGFKDGDTHVERTVSVGADDVEACKELIKMGVRLEYQQLPHEPANPKDFEASLKKANLI